MTTVFQAINFARDIRGRRLNGSVIDKYKWIQRVLADYIASKKAHVCHTTLDPQQTTRSLNVN